MNHWLNVKCMGTPFCSKKILLVSGSAIFWGIGGGLGSLIAMVRGGLLARDGEEIENAALG